MIRSRILQTHIAPALRRPRRLYEISFIEQRRRNSVLQESNSSHGHGRTEAILHGGKRGKGTNQSNGEPSKHANSNRSTEKSREAQKEAPSNFAIRRLNKAGVHKWQGRGSQKSKTTKRLPRDGTARPRKIELKDEAWVRQNLRIPTSKEYPDVPQGIFKTPKKTLIDGTAGLATLRSDFAKLDLEVFQCTVRYESALHTEVVIGEGRSDKAAESTAYLRLLAKFHELEILKNILDRKSETNVINRKAMEKTKAEERDAIMDIYNYAARFDAVPQVKSEIENTRNHRGRVQRSVKVTVELAEQAVKVEGHGHDLKSAEIQAALSFKTAAENYHAELGGKSLVIRDSTALTIDSAAKFIEFFKIVRPGVSISTDVKEGKRTLGSLPNRVQTLINNDPVGEAVEMVEKKKAEATALLTACVAIKNREPDLFPRFLHALKDGNGQILRPCSPIDMHVEADCSMLMRNVLVDARRAGLPDSVEDLGAPKMDIEARRGFSRRSLDPASAQAREREIKQKFTNYLQDAALGELRSKRADLPMNQYGAKVLGIVNNNIYSIIVGATGSGKTTQVPQILLEDAISKGRGAQCNVICTQPRRIAATSVARRVAEERSERLQESIGYHVRFDAKLAQHGGSINYCTTGIILQQLQHNPDEFMDNTSHLVIDEVHERDMLIDFLLILVKKNMIRRKAMGKSTPQVVLMSATMDTELFASYFKHDDITGKGMVDCPSLSVPGRTYPVRERYIDEIFKDMSSAKTPMHALQVDPNTKDFLEVEEQFRREVRLQQPTNTTNVLEIDKEDRSVIDWKQERKVTADGEIIVSNEKENGIVPFGLVATTVSHIARTTDEGAILVFLPGLQEIVRVEEELMKGTAGCDMRDLGKFRIHKLHSSMPAGQTAVFDAVPEGCRKIILSTNIAETSVTIPDVQHVVDSGKLREKQYDQIRRITQLSCTWISKSNSKQRAGRAGRVQNGNYYALFSKERYDSMRAIGLPELLRADLQEICLDVKAQAFKAPVREFLAEAIEPPSPSAVDASVLNLQALDALTENEDITPLGRLLAALPVHPTLGKMIVLGIIFRCLDPMLVLGAASAERSLFLSPLDARQNAQESKLSFVEGSGSDHIAMLNAVRELRQHRDNRGEHAMRDFAYRNYLHASAFKTIDATAKQIEGILVDSGLVPYTAPSRRFNSQFGDPRLNENSHKIPIIKALALAGFHPNLAVNTGGRSFRTPGEKGVMPHPSSTNAPRDHGKKEEARVRYGTLYSYSTMARSNDGNTVFMRDTTESTPLMASLFGGRLRRNEERGNILEMDNWLPFYVQSSDRRTAKTIIEFRKALERLLAIAFRELGTAARGRKMGERQAFLADERVREIFAEGLVQILDQDVKVDEGVRKRGWAARKVPGGSEGALDGSGSGGPGDRNKRRGERNSGGRSQQIPSFYQDMMKI